MLQIATLILFMEGSSKAHRQFITNRAQRYLSNATSCSILSLHSVSKVFFWSCKQFNIFSDTRPSSTRYKIILQNHCYYILFCDVSHITLISKWGRMIRSELYGKKACEIQTMYTGAINFNTQSCYKTVVGRANHNMETSKVIQSTTDLTKLACRKVELSL
jgi:hypothetical protein